jgi:acyl dehydratase
MTQHSFVVSRAEVRRFALSIGATDPVHHDVAAARAAGYRDLVAPAYFFQALGLSIGRLLPVDKLRADGLADHDNLAGNVVAAGSQVTFGDPICAGDEVRVDVAEDPPTVKEGSKGRLTLHTIHRRYSVDGAVAADEAYLRIGY